MLDELVAHLTSVGYHPRSSKHSDFQSLIIIRELVAQCPLLAQRAAAGEVVAKLRHHQQVGHADWVIDIAIGTSAGNSVLTLGGLRLEQIQFAPPVIIQIAIELKSIFTEHGKARRNRLRDFDSFHGYAHQYDPKTVAGAFLVVNSAEHFYSPLRKENDITTHGNSRKSAREVAASAIELFRSIHLRNSENDVPGLEAIGVVVIEHDNLAFHPNASAYTALHKPSRASPQPPNLPLGDPLNYQSLIQRVCKAYTERFP
jgi:hypothetical protein